MIENIIHGGVIEERENFGKVSRSFATISLREITVRGGGGGGVVVYCNRPLRRGYYSNLNVKWSFDVGIRPLTC